MTTTTIRPAARNVNADPRALRLAPISEADAANEADRLSFHEPEFTRGPARRPVPKLADPVLQWASGLQTNARSIYAGWLVEAGRDELLDAAMEQARFKQVTIKHGSGNLVTHWAVETANVFVVAEGVQSIGEMAPKPGQPPERYGIAFGWRTLEGGRQQSQLRARVYLRELLAIGFAEPLLLTVKGTLTGDLIAALTRQYDVLDACDAFRVEAGKPKVNPPFYACSIPLGPGVEVTRGTGNATKEITPMVALVPSPVTKEYVLAHWTKRAWTQVFEALMDDTISWSVGESAAIAEGADQAGGE